MQQGSEVGAYRVIAQIGAGGMGEVWLAEHVALGRRAAIKVLRPELSSRAEIVARFFNEARAAAAIQDPGIVQIFDFGTSTDGSAYIVMELLEGEPLDRRLARLGALPTADVLRLARQIATSLGAAHARGIVHRDLKPENIFVVRDPEVRGGERAKILDFGIAKLAGTASVKTQTAAMLGTPTYMSPEQCRGAGQVDARSDVYSLGCVIYRLVTGRAPFDADGAGEIIAMHLREPAPRASKIAPLVPRALDELIARCLEKDPEQRFASAAELASELAKLVAGGDAGAQVAATVVPTAGVPVPTTLSSLAVEIPRSPGSARWWYVGLATAALGALATFAIVRAGTETHDEPAGSGSPPADAPEPPTPPPPPPPHDDRPAVTARRVAEIAASFATWSSAHAGAPCPTASDLGVSVDDAWGHAVRITCREEGGQLVGRVVSAGPDGELDTADDIGADGPRWTPSPPAAPKPKPAAKPASTKKPPTAAPAPKPNCFDKRC